MRYTTIIDLRDWPNIYKNQNTRLIYLHLVLASGYQDYNRDLAAISLRRLAEDCGITFAATRHALGLLEQAKLIKRTEKGIFVAKWLKEKAITPRQKKEEGNITAHVAETPTRAKKSPIEQLKERAVAGDVRAREILRTRFNIEV